MFASLFACVWALHPDHVSFVGNLIARAIAAGPVDDAERTGHPIEKNGNTAVIRMNGPIIKYAGYLTRYGFSGTRDVQMAFEAAEADEDIKTIFFVLDTPGGSVDGLKELADVIANVKKPVIAQVDGMLASAGYFIASQADKIFASEDNLIGSIGTRTVIYDMSKYYEENGIKAITVDTGKYKSIGVPGKEVTEEHIADVQRIVDGYQEFFINAIMRGRRMDKKSVEAVADGRVFFANEALSLGLIDGVQTLKETYSQMVEITSSNRSTRRAIATLAELNI